MYPLTPNRIMAAIVAGIALSIAGCTTLAPWVPESAAVSVPQTQPGAAEVAAPEPQAPAPSQREPTRPARQAIIEIGTSPMAAAEGLPETGTAADPGDTNLNFNEVDVRELVKVVLGDMLAQNFVVDPKVGGKVTVVTSRPVRKEELLPLLEEILAMNALALVRTDGLYQVLPRPVAARGRVVPRPASGREEPGFGVRIVPLRYIAAPEMQRILEPLVADPASVRVDAKRNLLIAAGSAEELALVQETVDIFDVDWLRGMSVGLFPLEHVAPTALRTELEAVLGALEGAGGDGALGGLVRTVAIERLDSLLVIGSTAAALREVEIWVHRLDRPGQQPGKRLYVYEAQNAKATELADVLGRIFQAAAARTTPEVTLAPGLQPSTVQTPQVAPDAEAPVPAPGAAGLAGIAALGAGVEIIADDVRNALVILATPAEYRMVELALKRLDVVPMQVLIEASILEVTLRDDLAYGVEWFFKNAFSDHEGQGRLDLGAPGIAALSPAFSYAIVNNAEQVRVALNALSEESEVKVLSAPSLMVIDNQTATINVGDEIPVPTRQSVSNIDPVAPTVNEIQFRKTGVTLAVTPRVNASGLVTMEVRQEVSSAVPTTTSALDAPTIQNRAIDSVVAIHSGETIALGGLIQDNRARSNAGVPVLHKLPVLGPLFGQRTNDLLRTELVVLITPRVVRDRSGARDVTEEFRRKLRGLTPPPGPAPAAPADPS